MKIKNFIKTLLIVCILCLPSFLLADVPAGAPSAKNILVIQDSSFNFTQLIHELKNDSNSCTTGTGPSNIVTTINCNSDADWPASLAGYDQVWDLRWNGATYTLNGAMATALQGVLSSGGGVFILGENPGWDKPGITAFVNSVTTAGNFNTSGSTTGGGTETDILNASACTSAENFSTDYLNLATCNGGTVTSEFPGWIKVAELAGGFGVITNPTGAYAIGVAFISSVLKAPYNSGKLFVWYDEQAFRPPHSNCGANASM